jgi:hypothetical protein
MNVKAIHIFFGIAISLLFTSCSALFGNKEDEQVNEIFVQGAIDPNLIPQTVGYVPVYPFFQGFSNPIDVFVGYDELVYVVDDNGLNILDQKGTKYQNIPIPGATDVTQDRRLHTYVCGRVELPRGAGGALVNLPAVYHLMNTATGNYVIVDTLIHPDCDASRGATAFRGTDDEKVQFTGLATLHDNTLYVSRTGPRNDPNAFFRPDNGILLFDADGLNVGFANGLTPNSPSLKSAMGISAIATLAAPPQRQQGINTGKSFMLTQADATLNIEYRTLHITVSDDPDAGTSYNETSSLLNYDYSKGDRFLYQPFRFKNPEDCFIAPDALQYSFIVDSGTDSLYIFTNQGIEGVNPPANSGLKKQVAVSFGGPGIDGNSGGPFSFKDPSGVCYFRRMIFVADKGNHRICRYMLSTDLQ